MFQRFALLATLLATLLAIPAAALAGGGGASSRAVPGCVASGLSIVRGQAQGAAGHRFDRFRITNTSSHRCRLRGYPTFRFRNAAGTPIGFRSRRAGVSTRLVVLRPGASTHVTVGTVDPGVVGVPGACRPRLARSVRLLLPHRPHVYRVPITRRVCTTRQYRPTSYPVGF